MDKSWITKSRLTIDYIIHDNKGFLDFAFGKIKADMLKCPCQRCSLAKYKSRVEIEGDLMCHGFLCTYTNWYLHGEDLEDTPQAFSLDHQPKVDHIDSSTFNLLADIFLSMKSDSPTIDSDPPNLDSDTPNIKMEPDESADMHEDSLKEKKALGIYLVGMCIQQIENVDVTLGKKRGRQAAGKSEVHQWRKKSIFFELPYWKDLLLRHNLDVMHIEKNVFDNLVFTLLDDKGKSKDNLNARKDLQALGICSELWPAANGRFLLACFTMTNCENDSFLNILKNVKLPDGYSSNISACVDLNQRKMVGLKSHDCHILMGQLLSIAIRNVLPQEVAFVVMELCHFFREICSRVIDISYMEKLQEHIALTLCHLEMVFPPSFLTVMVHLTIHLTEEVKLGGPVQYRWMYPVEKILGHLKTYVRNRARPEGSICEQFIAEECLTFSSMYLEGIETRFNRVMIGFCVDVI
ncbi:unnamed protein product [Microthlaspi erraticum]|uniref:DUF4218 domain-containing protein n=1 Tax=Microthlaspi erraticum TaxID=1685480 RepID=A0A6D2JXH6_9BRAS|nr:unnamed protein product [Microthlaspi erraticum]